MSVRVLEFGVRVDSYRAMERSTAVVLSYCTALDTISIHPPPQRAFDSPAVHETSGYDG